MNTGYHIWDIAKAKFKGRPPYLQACFIFRVDNVFQWENELLI